ncbi:MAG: DNA polymerase III subunit beta [Planctomycetota bacterium]
MSTTTAIATNETATVAVSELASLLKAACVVARRKRAVKIPVGAGLLRVSDGQISVCCSDGELKAEYKSSADGELRDAVLDIRHLELFLKLAKGDVAITRHDGRTTFVAGELERSLPDIEGVDPDSFRPVVVDNSGDTVSGVGLRDAIGKLTPFIDKESSRYALGGIACYDGELAATDSRRLGIVKLAGITTKEPKVIPAVLGKLIPDEAVEIRFSENHVSLVGSGCVIESPLVPGRFPKYRAVVQQHSAVSLDVATKSFLECVTAASLATSAESRAVSIDVARGRMRLSGSSPENGRSAASLMVGESEPIGLIDADPRFIKSCLKACGPTCVFETTDPDSQFVIRDDDFTGIVMPCSRDR